MPDALTSERFVAALDRWAGQRVSVRVVTRGDDLLAVFAGRLVPRSDDKQPALFWPVVEAAGGAQFEQPGIYLHPERFESAAVHTGKWVLELRQADVTLNIRRL
jgi:hypothetical protein